MNSVLIGRKLEAKFILPFEQLCRLDELPIELINKFIH